jgi:manganese oxidase
MQQQHTLWSRRTLWFTLTLSLAIVAALAVASQYGVLAAAPTLAENGRPPGPGKTRTFYIAADEVEWDYAPAGMDKITGEPFDEDANVFVENGPDRIGKVYRKAQYREYTDASFTTLKPIAPQWQHLGIMGPVIHAEVGDSIVVVFKNNATQPYSVHPHGVFYKKDSEGAGYSDGTSGGNKSDDAVEPGQTYTYNWSVPERAGPGPGDPSSMMWMYHSHVIEPADENSGLMGPMIITARGKARPDGSPRDVDREFVMLFKVFDENSSLYLLDNLQTYATNHPTGADAEALIEDEDFGESNLMHAINGYVYGNLPGLTMKKGERVRWYTMAMGTEVDLHTPHWHGNTLLLNGSQMGMRVDVTELLPMSMKTLDMTPDASGTWLFHCHVNDHITAGMMALYTIAER